MSILDRALRYQNARKIWISKGKPVRSLERIQEIFDNHCAPCDKLKDGVCTVCDCSVRRDIPLVAPNKLYYANMGCPDNPPKFLAENVLVDGTKVIKDLYIVGKGLKEPALNRTFYLDPIPGDKGEEGFQGVFEEMLGSFVGMRIKIQRPIVTAVLLGDDPCYWQATPAECDGFFKRGETVTLVPVRPNLQGELLVTPIYSDTDSVT
jgi:hypothetical protein